MRLKNKKKCFSLISSYKFIRSIAQVLKSGNTLTFTVVMLQKWRPKYAKNSDHFPTNLRHLTEKLTWSTSSYQKYILTDDENYQSKQDIKSVCFLLLFFVVVFLFVFFFVFRCADI